MKAAITMFAAIAFASIEENHEQVTLTTFNIDKTIQEMENDIPEFPVWKEKPAQPAQPEVKGPAPEPQPAQPAELAELKEEVSETKEAVGNDSRIDVEFSELNNCGSDLPNLPQFWCDSKLTYHSSSAGGGSNPVTVELRVFRAVNKKGVEINGISMDDAIKDEDAKNLYDMIFQASESTNKSSKESKTVKISSTRLEEALSAEKPKVTQEEKNLSKTIYDHH